MTLDGLNLSFLTNLPQIPTTSPSLERLLSEYEAMTNGNERSTKIARKKSMKHRAQNNKKRLNGFMAFRAFYSRNIANYNSQKSLSQVLANAWNREKHQQIWSLYAIQYNNSKSKERFSVWLEMKLNKKLREHNSDDPNTWREINFMSDIVVEDVFQACSS
ncbi:hypothetical protein KL930_005382 [Ogataea haglerorum]|uniref:Alpha box domain-containing protein n=1 Tax=Ogataea haglerorum TaxID=1937702 RepID=A0AAN6D0E3_9ASCO|nr:uncharacterized protein KL911_005380 [Ogataea haglerorum]KAG7691331.1 hypothetical protein KL915_005359 [Ogataea haglerorum]KAG7691546.1 hypothetical protein KL951_005366 [Ogataea haglerorum]KAG7702125.1 hypothetical protein KL950_005386 [Ogataea haglerorum]KAG7702135.1 hypothetical protein KL914_005375 [Ogataea haglerorum]KAG7712933.1 hypothetical protein KL949_005376 [Ogataea haglerorum]